MNRSSFLKSLFMVVAAPKMLANLDLEPKMEVINAVNAGLFTDLRLLTPVWYEQMVAKYSNPTFLYWFENGFYDIDKNPPYIDGGRVKQIR